MRARIRSLFMWAMLFVPWIGTALLYVDYRRYRRAMRRRVEELFNVQAGRVDIRETELWMELKTNLPGMWAAAWEGILQEHGDPPNFLEFKFRKRGEPGTITVTVQKWRGMTPGEKLAIVERERDQLLSSAPGGDKPQKEAR